MMDELLKALDPNGELGLRYCSGEGRCFDKGAIFDPGDGEYGNHILASEQVASLNQLIQERERLAAEKMRKQARDSLLQGLLGQEERGGLVVRVDRELFIYLAGEKELEDRLKELRRSLNE